MGYAQIIDCRPAIAKPSFEPVLTCQWEPWEQISVKMQSNYDNFNSKYAFENVVSKMAANLSRSPWNHESISTSVRHPMTWHGNSMWYDEYWMEPVIHDLMINGTKKTTLQSA